MSCTKHQNQNCGCDEQVINQLRSQVATLTRERDEARGALARLGDVIEGGEFEEWLSRLPKARAAIAKARGGEG